MVEVVICAMPMAMASPLVVIITHCTVTYSCKAPSLKYAYVPLSKKNYRGRHVEALRLEVADDACNICCIGICATVSLQLGCLNT
jgi:hypothetical protein